MFTILLAALLAQSQVPLMRPIAKGPMSGVIEARQAIVRSAEEWRTLWAEHAGTRELPPVDFTREIVVAVFAGSRPTAGYDVEVLGVRSEGDATVVEYREHRPGRDAITAQVMTSPFAIVAIPRPSGEVRFEKR